MQKEKILEILRKRGTLGVFTLCLVGAVAFATYQTGYDSRNATPDSAVVGNEGTINDAKQDAVNEDVRESEHVAASTNDVKAQIGVNDQNADRQKIRPMISEHQREAKEAARQNQTQTESEKETQTEIQTETQAEGSEAATVDVSSGNVEAQLQPTVNFDEDMKLTWPAAGTVLMDYNMSSTEYFQTLNQYKYNPALIISSEVGNQVIASARGIVESIGTNEETGTTLVLNLGNNYTLTYGQLKEVTVAEGDVVEQGQLLGYVSEPTKYYCEEGSNLYFAMKKDGQAVDPFLYLE
ncbi:MAG: M23 family metallopeptidase [Eubacteriales bacterium]|nr:M23 family metallopeptidase [Eubacteriales bacterium]